MISEIQLLPNDNIESAVYTLLAAKARGERAFCIFNGHKLYSESVSMDSAYIECTGLTKAEHEDKIREIEERIIKHQNTLNEEQEQRIQELIEKGKKLIFPERYAAWEECVRNVDIGSFIDNAIEIMQALENGASIQDAKRIFDNQMHSGLSESYVKRIIFNFSSKGAEFIEATTLPNSLTPEDKEAIVAKKLENMQLAQVNVSEPENTGKHM